MTINIQKTIMASERVVAAVDRHVRVHGTVNRPELAKVVVDTVESMNRNSDVARVAARVGNERIGRWFEARFAASGELRFLETIEVLRDQRDLDDSLRVHRFATLLADLPFVAFTSGGGDGYVCTLLDGVAIHVVENSKRGIMIRFVSEGTDTDRYRAVLFDDAEKGA